MSWWLVVFTACVLGTLVMVGYCFHLLAARPKLLPIPDSVIELPPAAEVRHASLPPPPPAKPPSGSAGSRSARGTPARASAPPVPSAAALPDAFSDDEARTTVAAAYDAARRAPRPVALAYEATRLVPRSMVDALEATRLVRRCPPPRLAQLHEAITAVRPVIAYRARRRSSSAS